MTTQRKEVNNEQFFTNFETAARLAKVIERQPWFADITKVVEPSAGDGAWLKAMDVHEAYDIEPKHPDVKLQNFLEEDFKVKNNGKLLYVGNPPFGRMGKLAKQFMHKCAEEGDYIAFILPASFAKITQIRQIPEHFHLIYQEDLLEETFRFEREGKVVSTVFQIWEKQEEPREDRKKSTSCDDFEFVRIPETTFNNVANEIIALGVDKSLKKDMVKIMSSFLSQKPAPAPKNADLAICTHGSAVGAVYTGSFDKKSSRTHRFIKVKPGIDKAIIAKALRKLDYESVFKYTVGATCVSTEEIIFLYDESLNPKP
tara:strand:+ start:6031 stop:6972 length:942 start_codon:yes stop_codon:yes gene_type:complete